MNKRFRCASHLGILLGMIPGCASVKASLESSSGIVEGSITSLTSGSSAWTPVQEERYRDDVRLASRGFVEEERPPEVFLREIGRIAERHGLTDWEAEPATFRALGEGLGEADVPESELDGLLASLGRVRPADRELAREGYRSARR